MSITRHCLSIQAWLILLLCLPVFMSGCSSYPPMSQPAVQMARALYSLTNMKREGGLDKAAAKIDELLAEKAISEREAEYLKNVVEMGRQGKWEQAMLESRQIMEDQVPH